MGAVRAVLGKMSCLSCAQPIAAKVQGGNGRAVASCPWCGLQVQAFAPGADTFIRGLVKPLDANEGATSAGEVTVAKAEQLPVTGKAAKPAEEKTIFDYFKGGADGKG